MTYRVPPATSSIRPISGKRKSKPPVLASVVVVVAALADAEGDGEGDGLGDGQVLVNGPSLTSVWPFTVNASPTTLMSSLNESKSVVLTLSKQTGTIALSRSLSRWTGCGSPIGLKLFWSESPFLWPSRVTVISLPASGNSVVETVKSKHTLVADVHLSAAEICAWLP